LIRVRLFAAAREAAGYAQIEVASGSLKSVLAELSKENARLATVFSRCSFLVNGVAAHDQDGILLPGSEVDVLPPFAGG
jgi:molybdopterin converting factor small subunit